MGSSAMGASVLRKKVQGAGFSDVKVTNQSIANLTDTYGLVVTHQDLTARAEQRTPSAVHVSVDNFMNAPQYDEIVELLGKVNGGNGAAPAAANRPRTHRPRTCSAWSRSCWPGRRPPATGRSARRGGCWWPAEPSSRRTSRRCTSGRARCRRTWATAWPSRTAPTTPSPRSSAAACRSCATPSRSTGTASPPSSSSASPARARTTWRC